MIKLKLYMNRYNNICKFNKIMKKYNSNKSYKKRQI